MVKVNTQHLCLAVCVLTLVLVVVLVVRQNSSREGYNDHSPQQMGSNQGACIAKEQMRERHEQIKTQMMDPSITPEQRNNLAIQKDNIERNLDNILRVCPDN